MPFDDLAKALDMFASGVNQLQTSRAIASANDQVQQIRASEESDANKRAQLQQISNGMVSHLAGIGTPATTIQQVAGAFAPPQYKDANEMYMAGTLNNKPELIKEAKAVKDFDPQNKLAIAQMRYYHSMTDNKLAEKKAEFANKQLADIAKQDPSNKRGSPAGIVAQNLNKLQEADSLFQKGDANVKLQQLTELPIIINSSLGGGTGNQMTYEHLSPGKTIEKRLAHMREILTSSPQSANSPEFVAMYRDTMDRIKNIATSQLHDQIKSIYGTRPRDVALDPQAANEGFKKMLDKHGIEDSLSYDEKTKKISFESDKERSNVKSALEHVLNKGDLASYQLIEQRRPGEMTAVLRKNPKLNAQLLKLINSTSGM